MLGFASICNGVGTDIYEYNCKLPMIFWAFHSIFTMWLFTFFLLLSHAASVQFLDSHFSHCAVLYVFSKNVSNLVEDKWFAFRRSRLKWEDRKKRVVLTTMTIVLELFVLHWRYENNITSLRNQILPEFFVLMTLLAVLAYPVSKGTKK